jgi:hypothetical protein
MDCFAKTITLKGPDDERVIFRGERQVVPNCVISVMIVRTMMKKKEYLAYVMDVEKEIIDVIPGM